MAENNYRPLPPAAGMLPTHNPYSTPDFYNRIVVPEQTARPRHPIDIAVLGQQTIQFYNTELALDGDALYAFNVLLNNPEPATVEQLSHHGLDNRTSAQEFRNTVDNLASLINELAKTDIIGSTVFQHGRVFVLNPNVVVNQATAAQNCP
jgi:hypothetical protein